MKRIYLYLVLCTFVIGTYSCRPMGDDLLSYGQNDNQVFLLAGSSYAEEFNAFWLAMNENYGIWDYEEEFGLNWDDVFDQYMPKFEALDDSTRRNTVTDKELLALYSQFLDSLHDGHCGFQIKNLATGNYIGLYPNMTRNTRERGDVYAAENNMTTLDYYRDGQVNDTYRIRQYCSTGSQEIIVQIIDTVSRQLLSATTAWMQAIDAAGGPDQYNDSIYAAMQRLNQNAQTLLRFLSQPDVIKNALDQLVTSYNSVALRYDNIAKQVGVTMTPIDAKMGTDNLKFIRYALFEGNIAYLRLGGFYLSDHLPDRALSSDTASMFYAYQMQVRKVWHQWFDTIQTLYTNGQLGGIIIDVRNNGGGSTDDYQYVLGAFLPSGGWHSHTMRVKNGTGRLDFAPLIPFIMKTYEGPHAVINDKPIVLLANSHSVSMSENTTWGVKNQPNGYVIGTRTFGGLSALGPTPEDYSNTYSGAFGVMDVTPFYGYVPKFVCLYPHAKGLRPVEGVGFEPNESVPFDLNKWQSQGRDNQLERAIDYIHTR